VGLSATNLKSPGIGKFVIGVGSGVSGRWKYALTFIAPSRTEGAFPIPVIIRLVDDAVTRPTGFPVGLYICPFIVQKANTYPALGSAVNLIVLPVVTISPELKGPPATNAAFEYDAAFTVPPPSPRNLTTGPTKLALTNTDPNPPTNNPTSRRQARAFIPFK